MILIDVIATALGILMSAGYYPQAYRIWKEKSSKDVSVISYIIFGIGTTTWLLYGIYLKNVPIILSFLAGVIGAWLVLTLTLVYRKRGRKKAR